MMNAAEMQVLREIDKLDRLGLDGVMAMLGEGMTDASGAHKSGVGLAPHQIGMLRLFFAPLVDGTDEAMDNAARLTEMAARFARLRAIRGRLDLMAALEEMPAAEGGTLWDRLLAMPCNADDTWGPGARRPANIAFAIDDVVEALMRAGGATEPKGD